MSMFEKIIYNNIVIALIVHKDYKQEGIQFLSSKEDSLQLGYMKRPKGYQITPHIHKPVQRVTIGTQEILFIKKGKIRIDFYSNDRLFLESRILSAGDTVLLVGAGHGIEFLEEAEIIEVKNGPFIEGADKERFKGDREHK